MTVETQTKRAMDRQVVHLRTTGVLAGILNVPLHRVLYILRTRPHIQPSAFAGRMGLYDNESIAMIRHELNTIDAKTMNGKPC